MSAPSELPPFPVDDAALDMLMAAIDPRAYGDTEAESSCVGSFLDFMSELAGSDPTAVAEQVDDMTNVMRDRIYSQADVMVALVNEVRRLRQVTGHG